MEFFNSNIKNFLTFFQEKAFLKFPEMEPSSKNKKSTPRKISYTSGNGNPEKTYIFSIESF